MNKTLKWLITIVLTPILLFIILLIFLYVPPVQNWAVKKVADYASEKTGLHISVDHVSLAFPLDLKLEGFKALRPNDSIPNRVDTVADVRELVANVELLPLFESKVNIDALTFKGLKVNTINYIGDVQIQGDLDQLHIASRGVDLKESTAVLNVARLQGGYLDIALNDTMPEDTAKKPMLWKIDVNDLAIQQTKFRLRLPHDSMVVKAYFGKANAKKTHIDLYNKVYSTASVDWQNGALNYDRPYEPKERQGFDAAHIAMRELNLGLDTLRYDSLQMAMGVRTANFKEKSGLCVTDFRTLFTLDEKKFYLQNLYAKMPQSELKGHYEMDLNAFADHRPGKFYAKVDGFFHKQDLRPFLVGLSPKTYNAIPSKPISVQGIFRGNMENLSFRDTHISIPQVLNVRGSGQLVNMLRPKQMKANVAVCGKLTDVRFVKAFLPRDVQRQINIPRNIDVEANVKIRQEMYTARVLMKEGGGRIFADAFYDGKTEAYRVKADATNLQLHHFVPNKGLSAFTGEIFAQGGGLDIFAPTASLNLQTKIRKFRFGNYVLDGFGGNVRMVGGRAVIDINSTNSMLAGKFRYTGKLTDKMVDGHVKGWLTRIDLRRLGVMEEPYVVSTWADVDVKSDMKNNHYVCGPLRKFRLTSEGRRGKRLLASGDVDLTAKVRPNALDAHVKGVLAYANLKALGVMDKNYVVASNADLTIHSDMKKAYAVKGYLGNLKVDEHRGKDVVKLVAGNLNIDAEMRGDAIKGGVNGRWDHIDLYQLGVVDNPFTAQMGTNIDFATDMADNLMVRGVLADVEVNNRGELYQLRDVNVDVLSRRDTTHAVVESGDFVLNTAWVGSYKYVMAQGQHIATDLQKQIDNKFINQLALKALLPNGQLKLKSGSENLFSRILAEKGYKFNTADVNLTSSAVEGINGSIYVDSLEYDSLRFDVVEAQLANSDDGLNYSIQVINSKQNKYPYQVYLQGSFFEHGINGTLAVVDDKGQMALALSPQATMVRDGINIQLTSPKVVLGYKDFTVNEDNYMYFARNKRLSGNIQLKADDGAGVQLYTDDTDSTALQNFTIGVTKFELKELLAVLPFTPNISGELNGDYHVVQTATDLTVSSDMRINQMVYEGNKMGNVGSEFVYIPLEDGTHSVNGLVTRDGVEVGQLSGTYKAEGEGYLDAEFEMNKFPLSYINGLVPDRLIGLRGTGEGTLSVEGPLAGLDINGTLEMDSAYIFSEPYGIEMKVENQALEVSKSKIEFEDFKLYAKNGSPLSLMGYIDFANTDKMAMDIAMKANNFQLISEKENLRSEVYGKAYVDFVGRLHGLMTKLQLDGKVDLLGSTDMTYVMRDAQLATDTELEDLVTFTNLNDSTPDVVRRPDIAGFGMNLALNIDNQARIVCALNPDHSNYIDLIGGGAFTMTYDPTNGARLFGRYTMNDGQMKYSLPIIPLRTFQVQQGSYIEFLGNPQEPLLNITATERVRSNVSDGANSNGRIVDFETGVSLTKKFPNPGVEFIIQAPEDQEIQNVLNTKTVEERSKLAVTMLASGLYFDGANSATTNSAMNGALMGFLQSKVNAITGKALNSMGVNLTANMESTADATGSLHTDYTFKFSKRLLDNRLRIIMGGRVSTGSQMNGQNGAFFDNFSLEYRLNKKETQYLKLYYEREAYDWLEGNQGEFGIGYMWRRKLNHFKDIFKWRGGEPKQSQTPQQPKRDSLIQFTNEKKN